MNFDVNQLLSALIGGVAAWAGIKADLQFMKLRLDGHEKRIEKIEEKKAA